VKWDSVKWVVGEIFVGEMYPNRKSYMKIYANQDFNL
jgi:hypothetical protein